MQQHSRYEAEYAASGQYAEDSVKSSTTNYELDPIELSRYEQQEQRYSDGYRDQPGPQRQRQEREYVYANPPGVQMPPYGTAQQYAPLYARPLRANQPGVDGRIVAALSYIGFWFTGLVGLLFVRNNRFIRFHAVQSLIFYGGVNILYVAFFGFMWNYYKHGIHLPGLLVVVVASFILMNAIAGIAWLVGFIGALSGKYVKLPFVGDFAEQFVNRRPPLHGDEI